MTKFELKIKSEINKMLLLATTKNKNALWSHLNDGEASESFHKAFESSVSLIQHGYHDKKNNENWVTLAGGNWIKCVPWTNKREININKRQFFFLI